MKEVATIDLKMEEICYSENSVDVKRNRRHYFLENRTLHTTLFLELDINIQLYAPVCSTPADRTPLSI
jgi:hypothetical protein